MKTLETNAPAPVFASPSRPQARWSSFGISFVGQAVLLVVIAKSGISFIAPVIDPDLRESVHLVVAVEPPPRPTTRQLIAKSEEPATPPRIETRAAIKTPAPIEVSKQRVDGAKVAPPALAPGQGKTDISREPDLAAGVILPAPAISTNLGGTSASVTRSKPAPQVQIGGFGDPNAVPANPNIPGRGPVIAKLGSFDLPKGTNIANDGTGPKGARATTPAGFDNGIAVHGEEGAGSAIRQQGVRSANFAAAQPAPVNPPRPQPATTVSRDIPVSLLSKPTPSYTPEARQRKVEGDVELDVEFTASGQVRVLRVIQGLGYGLDEAAVKAAENIRFSPARRDGQPVDAHGRLRIVFRLS